MVIINQDMDEVFLFDGTLMTIPAIWKGKVIGYNLYCGQNLLGTFDTSEEAQREVDNISNCKMPFYVVDGHSNWETMDELLESLGGVVNEMDQ